MSNSYHKELYMFKTAVYKLVNSCEYICIKNSIELSELWNFSSELQKLGYLKNFNLSLQMNNIIWYFPISYHS